MTFAQLQKAEYGRGQHPVKDPRPGKSERLLLTFPRPRCTARAANAGRTHNYIWSMRNHVLLISLIIFIPPQSQIKESGKLNGFIP